MANHSPMVTEHNNLKSFRFGGVTLDFDREATSALYDYRGCNMWCQCSGCTNFQEACVEYLPRNFVAVLLYFGIDPFEPEYGAVSRRGLIPHQYRRYRGEYLLAGYLREASKTRRVQVAKGSWLWIDSYDRSGKLPVLERNYHGEKASALLVVKYSVLLPWVLTPEEESELY